MVGARCAGSATAMLMARAGMRVLLLDRVDPARDTLSTHALMRAGVLQLDRWGLLDEITAARHARGHRHDLPLRRRRRARRARAPLYAPRRTVLDPVLLDAARGGGRRGRGSASTCTAVTRDDGGRVTGVRAPRGARAGGGARRADGRRRRAALRHRPRGRRPHDLAGRRGERVRLRLLAGRATSTATAGSTGPAAPRASSPRTTAWPASGPALPAAEFAARRRAGLDRVLADGARARGARREFPARGAGRAAARLPGLPARLRRPAGAGWALVGDAGSFKDPLTAHGITDALRDAELLARAAIDGSPAAFDGSTTRDALTLPLLRVAEEIAAYRWDSPGSRTCCARKAQR